MELGSSSYVGEGVVIDILSRLPVKLLIRFRCVCKSWYDLIKSPYFINKHLQQNKLNQYNAPLFVISCKLNSESSVWWISSSNNEGALENIPSIDLASRPFSHGRRTENMGPVRGIYCAGRGYEEESIFLCNPSLREVRSIPEVPYPCSRRETYVFGFGYDSRSNDFKVVAVYKREKPIFVFMYTLSSNSWRKIESNNLPERFEVLGPDVFLSHGNGIVHRLADISGGQPSQAIVSFDLGTEVFKNLKLPPSATYSEPTRPDIILHKRVYLSKFNNSMVVILTIGDYCDCDHYSEIWVMMEYGVDDSWTKLYNIGPLRGISRPFMLWKNGEVLFGKYWPEDDNHEEKELISYDPHLQQFKLLHIPNPFRVLIYMESLVSIK